MIRAAAAILVTVAVGLSPSCKKEGEGRPSLDVGEFDDVPAAGTVRLKSAGSEPRRVLRYTFKQGDRQRLDLHMKMKSTVKLEDASMPLNMGMKYGTELVVQAVDGERAVIGFSLVDFSMVEAETNSMIMKGMAGLGDVISGMRGEQTIDSRGRIHAMSIDLSRMRPEMRQAMEKMQDSMKQMSAPLPEEAVGVGARWRGYQLMESQGMKIKQQVEFELLEMKGDTIVLGSTILQDADLQIAEMAGVSGGTTEVLEFWSRGTGTVSIDLARFSIDTMRMALTTRGKMKVSAAGSTMNTGMEADMTLQMGSR